MFNILSPKRCTKCGEVKELDQFKKDRRNNDGHGAVCKACHQQIFVVGWQKSHPEIVKRNRRNNYAKHGDNIRTHSRVMSMVYRILNAETVHERDRIRARKAREEDKEKVNARNRKSWHKTYEKNKDRYHAKSANYMARKKDAEGEITSVERKELFERYGNKCLCCGRTDVPLTLDHVIPLVRGGSNTIDNAQPLCRPCNSSKGTKSTDYR